MNQISLASLMMHLHMNKGELEEDMVRHMILNSVRMYRTMFNEEYGEVVITYDSRNKFFPNINGIVEKIENLMIKIGIVYSEFLIRLKMK